MAKRSNTEEYNVSLSGHFVGKGDGKKLTDYRDSHVIKLIFKLKPENKNYNMYKKKRFFKPETVILLFLLCIV